MRLEIDPDITVATLPPAEFYQSKPWYREIVERVFARSWQVDPGPPVAPGSARPFVWLEGSVQESLVWTRLQDGRLRCLSNVCTHRGARVCRASGEAKTLTCPYHGRRFGLDGRLRHAPGFEQARDFPRERDHLAQLAFATWGPLRFSALSSDASMPAVLDTLDAYFGFLEAMRWRYDQRGRLDYGIDANWLLYCDNYLEGFHVPFVHPGLSRRIEMATYEVRKLAGMVLQVAFARKGEPAFDPPPGHPDHGRRVAAWYLFVFPNLMLNVYPWGLSLNRVRPLAVDRCVVEYARWLSGDPAGDARRMDEGAGADLDQVELEDQEVVQSTQLGLRSRLYPGGRYSPNHEQGLHHFHRWLAEALSDG